MSRSVRTPSRTSPPRTRLATCPHCQSRTRAVNGAWLRWARERAQIDQRTLAQSLKVSGPYLSDIERNRRDCPEPVYRAYQNLLTHE